MSWSYLHWLVAISAAFVLLERLLPWRRGHEEMPQGLLGELAWPVRWSSRPPS